MNPIKRITMSIVAGALLAATGCATPPQALLDARAAYEEAENSRNAQLAPTEIREAEQALMKAEEAYDKVGPEDEATLALSYVAERKAKAAMVTADVYEAKKDLQTREKMLLAANEDARSTLKNQLAETSELSRLTAQQLQNEREKYEKAQAELKDAEAKGNMTEEQLAAERARIAELGAKLEAEKQARADAEKRLAETRAQLEKIAKIKEEARKLTITLNGAVLFEVGKAQLMTVAEQRLDQVAEVLLAERGAEIVVLGHTDSQGSDEDNRQLSRDRANAVRTYLLTKGIAADRITAEGMGESQPVASNDTPEGRANNRRVEIVVNRQPQS